MKEKVLISHVASAAKIKDFNGCVLQLLSARMGISSCF
jgi:hypothetical protein